MSGFYYLQEFAAEPSERRKEKQYQVLLWKNKLHVGSWGVVPSLRHGWNNGVEKLLKEKSA